MLNDIKSGLSSIWRVSLQLRGAYVGGGTSDPPLAICFRLDDDDELFIDPGRGRVAYAAVVADPALTVAPMPLGDNVLCARTIQRLQFLLFLLCVFFYLFIIKHRVILTGRFVNARRRRYVRQ